MNERSKMNGGLGKKSKCSLMVSLHPRFYKCHCIIEAWRGILYNKEYLTKYNGTSKSKGHEVPGHAYFNKARTFFESHYDKGELYMKLLKRDCSQKDDELCDTCSSAENKWRGPATKCTPRPYQDPTQLPSYYNKFTLYPL